MSRIATLITRHRLAVLLAFALGALVVAPQAVFTRDAAYRGIAMTGTDAEEYYVARIQEVYDGNPRLSNVFLSQKEQIYLVPGLSENLVARLGQATGMTAVATNVAAKFVLPLVVALLVYALIFTLSASIPASLLASVLVVAGDAVLGGPRALVGVLTGRAPMESFLLFARPINPEVSALFLFGALLILVHFFFKERRPAWFPNVVLGLLAGGALYISPFVSSFLFGVFGLSLLWFVFKKDYTSVKALAVSIAVGVAALAPYVLNLLALRRLSVYADLSMRQGLIHTHAPIIGFWLVALGVSLFVWPRRFLAARPFFAIAVAALVILLNQQVVTGLAIQPAHYHWYITKPLAGMVLALFAAFFIERVFISNLLRRASYGVCIVLLFTSATLVQRDSYRAQYANAVAAQAYAPVLSFLKTLPEQAVWVDRTLSLYIPMYTKQDVPNHDFVQFDLVSQDFLERRLLLEYALRGIKAKEAFATMQNEREDIARRLFGVYWRDQYGSYAAIPDSLLAQYADDYTKSSRESIPAQLRSLGASIFVWDTKNSPAGDMGRTFSTKPIFSAAGFEVYQLATTTGEAL